MHDVQVPDRREGIDPIYTHVLSRGGLGEKSPLDR
jgi:hypothetical protein